MDSAQKSQAAVCGKEALDLLNCATENPFDQEKCLLLLQSLRQCILSKKVKKFSLADENPGKVDASSEKKH